MAQNHSKKNILITGSSGFIGKNLITKLVYHNVIKLSTKNLSTKFSEHKKPIDIIIHLGAVTPYNIKKNKSYLKENYLSVLDLLNFSVQNKIKKIIFCSTYVYGNPTSLPINELHLVSPHNEYAQSKYFGEQLCEFYHKFFGIDIIILRPFNIYGPNQNSNYLIPNIIDSILTNKKIKILNVNSKRDFLHVDDFISLILKLISNDFKFEIYNVGSGKSFSFKQIIKKCENLTKQKINAIYENDESNFIPEIRCDNSKITHDLDWNPEISINMGLKSILKSKL